MLPWTSALILFLVDPIYAFWFVVILIVIQQLDGNIFKPKIIGNQLGISSFWVLFSVIVGGALFGIPGFILGTPIYAAIYTLVGKKVRYSIDSKGELAQAGITATRHVPNTNQIEVTYANGVTEITTAEGLQHKLSYRPVVTDDYK